MITKESTSLITTLGKIASCDSSKGDFGPTWKFPNGTNVSTQTSTAIQQTNGSAGFKQLRLNSLKSGLLNGDYTCVYTANGVNKTKTVNVECKNS